MSSAAPTHDRPLKVGQEFGPKRRLAASGSPVAVPERRREEVATALPEAERVRDGHGIRRRRISALERRASVVHAVLLPADEADLELEQDPELVGLPQELRGETQILAKRQLGSVEHGFGNRAYRWAVAAR